MLCRSRSVLALALLVSGLGVPVAAQSGLGGGALEAEPALPEAASSASSLERTVEYLYDDGAASVNVGPPSSFDPDMLWGNYYVTEPGGEVITEIAVAFGPTFPSLSTGPVTFWLLDDPDADADPRNATALVSVDARPTVFGNTFYRVSIPPTRVSGAFFVGASAQLLGGKDRPARLDTGARSDRSWFFYAPDIAATIDSLGAAPFGTRLDDAANVPFPGAFMIRAVGQPAGMTDAEEVPLVAAPDLYAAAPNPVSSATTVRFVLPRASVVSLDVLDGLGRRVATLAEGEHAAGTYATRWNVRGVAPGVYVCRLRAGGFVRSVRLVVAP